MKANEEEAARADSDHGPYESMLQSVVDMHDYSALRKVCDGDADYSPRSTEVTMTIAGDPQNPENKE